METTSNGSALLSEEMRERGLKDASTAELIGCKPALVCRLRAGKRTPSLKLAVSIQREFGIEPAAWVDQP